MARDMTTGSEYKALFYFSLPILIGNVFQQFYNVADSIIVGRLLGRENLAAVGFCFQFSLIITAISMGLTLGSGILISRYFGAGNKEQIQSIIDTGFFFSLALSALLSALGVWQSQNLIGLFGVPADTAPYAFEYLRIIFFGTAPVFMYNTVTNILRGLGDSKGPVYFLIGAALLNIILDLLFVKYLHTGIKGAAYVTVISQCFSFAGSFIYLRFVHSGHRVRLSHPALSLPVLLASLRLGIPSMMQQVFRSLGFMTLQGLVNGFGSTCMAAYAATSKIDAFALLPSLNLSQALSNFTAQNRGAGREDRARKGFKAALIMGLFVTLTIMLIVIPFPDLFIGLFTKDAEVIQIGRTYLRIVGAFYFVETIMQMFNGILLGYEKPFVPMVSTIVSLCLMQVPAAYLLSATPLGYTGIWIAAPFGWFGGVLIRLYYYRRYVSTRPTKS